MSGLLAGIIATLAWALVPSTLVPIHFSTPTAATIPTRHPSGVAVVGTDTIPAFQPAGFLAAFLDRGAGSRRLPQDLSGLLPFLTEGAAIRAVEAILADVHDDDAVRNEAANLLRRSQDLSLDALLIGILDRSDETERMRSFAAQHLGISVMTNAEETAEVRARLLVALGDRQPGVRREALLALSRVKDASAVAVVRSGLDDPAWSCAKDLVVRLAYDLDLHRMIPAIRPLMHDQDAAVQIAAIFVLGQWQDRESAQDLAAAANSSSYRVRTAAAMAMERLRKPSTATPHEERP